MILKSPIKNQSPSNRLFSVCQLKKNENAEMKTVSNARKRPLLTIKISITRSARKWPSSTERCQNTNTYRHSHCGQMINCCLILHLLDVQASSDIRGDNFIDFHLLHSYCNSSEIYCRQKKRLEAAGFEPGPLW